MHFIIHIFNVIDNRDTAISTYEVYNVLYNVKDFSSFEDDLIIGCMEYWIGVNLSLSKCLLLQFFHRLPVDQVTFKIPSLRERC